ncbi:MAG: DUF2158 domain-containing protein [Pseudomonadota bacterium]
MEFKIGDVVQLKSGGPKMTVAAVKQDRAICVWFNGQNALHEEKSAEFLLATLKRTIHAASASVSAGS